MKAKQHQTILDIAIQDTGSAEAVYGLALLNGLSVTDELLPGQELELPEVANRTIVSYFKTKNIRPATAIEVFPQTWDDTFNFTFIF